MIFRSLRNRWVLRRYYADLRQSADFRARPAQYTTLRDAQRRYAEYLYWEGIANWNDEQRDRRKVVRLLRRAARKVRRTPQ